MQHSVPNLAREDCRRMRRETDIIRVIVAARASAAGTVLQKQHSEALYALDNSSLAVERCFCAGPLLRGPSASPALIRARLQIAREIPWIMKNYALEEITTASKLRSQLADIFRQRASPDSRVCVSHPLKPSGEMPFFVCIRRHFRLPCTIMTLWFFSFSRRSSTFCSSRGRRR